VTVARSRELAAGAVGAAVVVAAGAQAVAGPQRERAKAGRARPAAEPLDPAWRRAWARLRHGRAGGLAGRVVATAAVPLAAEVTALRLR